MKLKSNGSGPLVIKNASLLGRSAISVEVELGTVSVVKTDAFNPALTIEQLMKQALSRIRREATVRSDRVRPESEFTWQVDCDQLSFAMEAAVFRPLSLDLDEAVKSTAPGVPTATDDSSQLKKLSLDLVSGVESGALMLVEVPGTTSSMSFRLEEDSIEEKLTEIIGELTRDGTDRSKIRVLAYSANVRSRRELNDAIPVGEYRLVQESTESPSNSAIKTYQDMDISGRFQTGLSRWIDDCSARLLLLDGPSSFLSKADLKQLIAKLRKEIGPDRICLIIETEHSESCLSVPESKLPEYDRALIEFRKRARKDRFIDWIGIEAELAKLFALLPGARRNGLIEKDFILGSSRYPCPSCGGDAVTRVKMGPFGEVHSACEVCSMTGFGESVLQVMYNDFSFREVLCGSVFYSTEKFSAHESLLSRLKTFSNNDFKQLRLADKLLLLPDPAVRSLILSRVNVD